MEFRGKRAAVVGVGVSNLALTRYLIMKGAIVAACDRKPLLQMGQVAAELEALGIPTYTGSAYLEPLANHDLIFLTPGMPKHLPEIQAARARGAWISGEIGLVMAVCPAPIIGITGTAGKTTTTTLIGEVLREAGREVYVGGNIGRPLIESVEEISTDAAVVLELSSFQLQLTGETSPQIAVMTNLSPNHLDVHASLAEYYDSKQNIFRYQKPSDTLVSNYDDQLLRDMAAKAPGRVVYFSRLTDPGGHTCAFIRGDDLVWRYRGQEYPTLKQSELRMAGEHNVENALAAMAAGYLAGAGLHAVRAVLTSFTGVEHRLEQVRSRNGVLWFNDSKATSPVEAVAALRTLPAPIVLIAGGSDKGIPFEPMAPLIAEKVKALILTGPTAHQIEAVARSHGYTQPVHHAANMNEAVSLAATVAVTGDRVALSPGCASFDAYQNFEHRGRHFKELVMALD